MGKREKTFSSPLKSEQKQEKAELVDALASFWHNTSFQRHWASPPFLYVDVKPQIDSAADMVVRIRSYAKQKHPDAVPHHTAGAGIEYLWSLHEKPTNLEAFEDGLTQACLMDEEGFVAPLDEQLVQKYIEEIRLYRKRAAEHELDYNIKAELEALSLLLDEIQPTLDTDADARDGVLSKVRELNAYMEGIAKKALEEEEARQKAQAEAAAAKEAEAAAAAAAEDAESSEESSSVDSDERRRMKASIERANQTEKKMLEIQKIADATSRIEQDVRAFEDTDLRRLEDDSLDARERHGLFDRLKKRALEYSVKLERELLALDALGGEDIRPKRKEQVLKIQNALKHVDKLQSELKKFHEAHVAELEEEKRKEEEEKERQRLEAEKASEPEQKKAKEQEQNDASAAANTTANAAAEATAPANDIVPALKTQSKKPLLERFASLKLDVDFQVRDGRTGYQISAYVPGLDEKELRIALSEARDVLTCEGRRLPTPKEIDLMRYQLRQRYSYEPSEEDELLLRYGAGRFGSFKESWRIDEATIDPDAIEASYERGNLELFIPRRQPRVVPQMPGRQRYQQRMPGYGGYPGHNASPFYW